MQRLMGHSNIATTSSGNIVTNGGFELPVVATSSYQLFPVGQHFSGWRVVGAPGNVAVISGAFQQSGLTFLAKAGKQWLDLTGVSNTKTGVAQTVRTVRGSNYRLTFSVGNVYDPGGIFGVTSTVEFLNGDPPSDSSNGLDVVSMVRTN